MESSLVLPAHLNACSLVNILVGRTLTLGALEPIQVQARADLLQWYIRQLPMSNKASDENNMDATDAPFLASATNPFNPEPVVRLFDALIAQGALFNRPRSTVPTSISREVSRNEELASDAPFLTSATKPSRPESVVRLFDALMARGDRSNRTRGTIPTGTSQEEELAPIQPVAEDYSNLLTQIRFVSRDEICDALRSCQQDGCGWTPLDDWSRDHGCLTAGQNHRAPDNHNHSHFLIRQDDTTDHASPPWAQLPPGAFRAAPALRHLVHEYLHVLFRAYRCDCKACGCPWAQRWLMGASGHGPLWEVLRDRVERFLDRWVPELAMWLDFGRPRGDLEDEKEYEMSRGKWHLDEDWWRGSEEGGSVSGRLERRKVQDMMQKLHRTYDA